MLLVENHAVGGIITAIRLFAELTANGDLSSETDYSDTNLVINKRGYHLMNVTGIRGKERAENDKNFPCAMTGSMTI